MATTRLAPGTCCGCGGGGGGGACDPCDLPLANLSLEWSSTTIGDGTGTMVYNGNPTLPLYTMACTELTVINGICAANIPPYTTNSYMSSTFACNNFDSGLPLINKIWCDSGCSVFATEVNVTVANLTSYTCDPFMLQFTTGSGADEIVFTITGP